MKIQWLGKVLALYLLFYRLLINFPVLSNDYKNLTLWKWNVTFENEMWSMSSTLLKRHNNIKIALNIETDGWLNGCVLQDTAFINDMYFLYQFIWMDLDMAYRRFGICSY